MTATPDLSEGLFLSMEELHKWGVGVARASLEKEDARIIQVYEEQNVDPQIVFEMEGRLSFLMVRTVVYPAACTLEAREIERIEQHAQRFGAEMYFRGVGFLRTKVWDWDWMGVPLRHGTYDIYMTSLQKVVRGLRLFPVNWESALRPVREPSPNPDPESALPENPARKPAAASGRPAGLLEDRRSRR